MGKNRLSGRELDVMNVLWNSEEPLIASEIVAANKDLNVSTVQVVLKKLLSKNYIRVSDIVYSGKVLSRKYEAIKDPDDFLQDKIEDLLKEYKPHSVFQLDVMAALVKHNKNDEQILQDLEDIIQKRKKELGEGEH